jgi:hypothetical protein
MKTLEIATDLKDNTTNVIVNNIDELKKFIKFAGGEYNVFAWVDGLNEWMTIAEFTNANELEDIF